MATFPIIVKKKYTHYLTINVPMSADDYEYNVHVVYFINCMIHHNYMDWLINQVNIVKNYGILHIVAVISKENEKKFRDTVNGLFPDSIIYCTYENKFEYDGILKVWELGQIHNKKTDIILYFHSKGMTHYKEYKHMANDPINNVLLDINKIKEIYSLFPTINKIGQSIAELGWIWYNFWYARGSYVYNVEKPIVTNRRHYYEDWLSRCLNDDIDQYCETERTMNNINYNLSSRDCYGFYTNTTTIGNIGSYFNANDGKYYPVSLR
jgi:hypothetical protein